MFHDQLAVDDAVFHILRGDGVQNCGRSVVCGENMGTHHINGDQICDAALFHPAKTVLHTQSGSAALCGKAQRGFYRHDNRIKGRQSVVADQTGAQDAHFFEEIHAVVRRAVAAKTDITAGFQKRRRFGEAVVDEIGKGTMNKLYPVFG